MSLRCRQYDIINLLQAFYCCYIFTFGLRGDHENSFSALTISQLSSTCGRVEVRVKVHFRAFHMSSPNTSECSAKYVMKVQMQHERKLPKIRGVRWGLKPFGSKREVHQKCWACSPCFKQCQPKRLPTLRIQLRPQCSWLFKLNRKKSKSLNCISR